MVLTVYGKQNYGCLLCGRQFVIRDETVCAEDKELIKTLPKIGSKLKFVIFGLPRRKLTGHSPENNEF
ncbi:MAG: hypothetical protein ACR2MD_11570 [Aridibacter sp.]